MPKIGRYQNRGCYKTRRQKSRNNPTIAERVMWKHIRNNQLGVKFRRQFNIDFYIVDFYCHELKLILEVDGWVHGDEKNMKKDLQREAYLKEKGYKILRYRNEQLKYEMPAVLQDIINHITNFSLHADST